MTAAGLLVAPESPGGTDPVGRPTAAIGYPPSTVRDGTSVGSRRSGTVLAGDHVAFEGVRTASACERSGKAIPASAKTSRTTVKPLSAAGKPA